MTLFEKLNKKNILFFSVKTFGLELKIISKLQSFGANVKYYDERPSNSIYAKGIIRIKRGLYQKNINQYYNSILESNIELNYDYLFVNRGEVVPEFFLIEFKKNNPNCIFIFYTWDSIGNHSHPKNIIKYFDRKFTFDHEDAMNYNLGFRPLFFLDEFVFKNQSTNIKYDLIFLGTAHSDRYKISSWFKQWCNYNNLTMYCYYYIQGRLVFLYKKIFDKSFGNIAYKKLSFKSLNINDIVGLYESSNVILDINHPNQKGLTMRTFEAIGLNKKLITTNENIRKYQFYNPNNIFIINRNNLEIDNNFFNSSYQPIIPDLYNNCSMEGWLTCLFIESQSDFWLTTFRTNG